jgi:hypothetical protein
MTTPSKPDPGDSVKPRTNSPEYRAQLITGEQKAQTDFDRTVIALSGGALGISFAFVEKIIGTNHPVSIGSLMMAWGSWVLSLASVLLSHYFSALAMRHALVQHDSGRLPEERVGGAYDRLIPFLNAGGAIAFLVGAVAAGIFVVRNL